MRAFLARWYGKSCPAWTWPATIGSAAVMLFAAAAIADYREERRCFAHGGNKSMASGCYSVVKTKIY